MEGVLFAVLLGTVNRTGTLSWATFVHISGSLRLLWDAHPLHHTRAQNQAGSHPKSLHVSVKTVSRRKPSLQ